MKTAIATQSIITTQDVKVAIISGAIIACAVLIINKLTTKYVGG